MKFCANPLCQHHVEWNGEETMIYEVAPGGYTVNGAVIFERRIAHRSEWRSPKRRGGVFFCEKCTAAITALHRWESE